MGIEVVEEAGTLPAWGIRGREEEEEEEGEEGGMVMVWWAALQKQPPWRVRAWLGRKAMVEGGEWLAAGERLMGIRRC